MKRRPRRFNVVLPFLLVTPALCAGCVTHSPSYEGFDASDPNSVYLGPNGDPDAPPPVSRYSKRKGTEAPRYGAKAVNRADNDAHSLEEFFAELEASGDVDGETLAKLRTDFEQTDPALWPMLKQTFLAGLAYRNSRSTAVQVSDAPAGPPNSSNATGSATAVATDDREVSPAAQATPAHTTVPTPQATPAAAAAPTAASAIATPAQPATAAAPTAPPAISSVPPASAPAPQVPNAAPQGGTAQPTIMPAGYDATGQSLAALQAAMPGNGGGASSLPTQALLAAALAEAQRQAAESTSPPPPAGSTPRTAMDDPFAVPETAKPFVKKEGAAGEQATAKSGGDAEGTWQQRLNEAIAKLEPLTREPPKDAADVSRHAWLRMLYLTAGRRDDALKPIAGISAAEQDYWSEQLYALATTLDVERTPDAAQRAAEARRHLAKAETRLAETGLLTVRNLAFCTEVSSYGVYQKFAESTFKPNQPLILYAEVDNFKSEETTKGFHTALRSSYQILDAQGRRVAENDLALTEEYCRNRRRDYFIRYFLSVPERIYEGKYTLQLTIVDTLSQKIGQASIDFTVGETK